MATGPVNPELERALLALVAEAIEVQVALEPATAKAIEDELWGDADESRPPPA